MSTALVCACVHAPTCVHACRQGLPGNEWSQCGWRMSAVWDLMGGWERAQRDKNAWQCSGEAITTKKRFVPEKFLPCAYSYEGKVCAWTAVGAGVGHELANAAHSCTCYDMLTYKGTFMSMTTHWAGELKHPNTRNNDLVWEFCFILCCIKVYMRNTCYGWSHCNTTALLSLL